MHIWDTPVYGTDLTNGTIEVEIRLIVRVVCCLIINNPSTYFFTHLLTNTFVFNRL